MRVPVPDTVPVGDDEVVLDMVGDGVWDGVLKGVEPREIVGLGEAELEGTIVRVVVVVTDDVADGV